MLYLQDLGFICEDEEFSLFLVMPRIEQNSLPRIAEMRTRELKDIKKIENLNYHSKTR